MATLDEISATLDEVKAGLETLDTDFDGLAKLVADLHAGAVSQAQIDAIGEKVDALKAKTAALVTEEEAIK